ncbi:glycosyltransferase family 2 protein [Acidocella sp.]|uniref:glycosyltransferase family 2 protein n=1 Tax=Acidocella sp. TaxID=50710 RepID=UPI0026103D07|nr:glycosyltransferase [Acidocella sp.]
MPANDASPELRLSAGSPPPLDGYDADIIILSLDRLEETIEAIKSALQQRGGTIHVTVLDQGSSPEMLRELRHQFSRHPHFSLYESGRNLGVPGGRTAAAGYGHGQFIVALDNDAVFETPWVVAKALRLFRQTPDLAAIGFNILAADGKQPDMTSWGYPKAMLPRYRDSFDTTTFVGAGHAIRRSAWTAAGGYDPSLFFTWEEYDFCLKVIALNWRITYAGSLAVIHKVSPEARISWNSQRMRYFVRNRLIIGRKWGSSWLALTPRIAGYLMKAARLGCIRAAWNGVKDAHGYTPAAPRRMSRAMRRYISHNETKLRGPWLDRLKLEFMSRIPH